LLLQGTINFLSALWEREIDEEISFYSHPNPTKAESTLMDMLHFDINLNGKDNIRMVNSFGNINNRIRLRLTGDNDFPILIGVVESNDGTVNFSDKTFNLIRAKLIFKNKFLIDPLVDIQSEAFFSNYRIRFNVKGKSSKLKPEFHSSPPLPPQDILALISLGEFFKRPTSTEMSSQISATSLGTTKLTEQIEKRLKNILGIDFLQVAPMLNGTTIEGESRVSVGKSIAKDFLIVYSTNISSTRQEILYLQYQISPAISLIGMKNEEGRFSIDIRFRKRR
jgi:autotransporter translocation and assembly factor TamB